ncbi:LOW QUALITY PROTEIN: bZIP transcription factor 50-like [Curcuma longa]|uniref:LOW QUALITY PROTEIN: bZIP transcription factor 50-like n=1 Tax=Curcuma longa TaxID=136217 RepID=UPI003D9F002A
MPSTAEAPIAASPAADDLDFDVEDLLQSFCYDDLFDLAADIWIPELSPPPSTTMEEEKSSDSPPPESGGSSDTLKSYVSNLEKVLMEEEEEEDAVKESCDVDDFVACLFAEGSRDGGSDTSTPESEEEVLREGKEDKQVEGTPATVSADGEDDDPVSKKLRRQMRNRDSAMKSRERKKIYVKELEMKSKYLEAECRRLDYALRCCAAENLSLRQCLQKEKLFDASAAKQESAVLLEESLLLGSLLWLASIICLFLLPVLPNLNLKGRDNPERGRDHEIAAIERVTTETPEKNINSRFWLVSFGKICRGTRTRIKDLVLLHAIEAS